ncbi:unnamed protein product [[Candida] boidinii]|nr:unnamed protein product [[Candida] boidinii]
MGLKKFFKPPKEMTQEESREFLENNGVTVKRDYASDGRRFKFGEFSKYTKDKVSKQEPLRPRGWTPPPDPNDSANDFNSSNNDLNASNIPPYSAPANSNTGNSSDPYSSGNGNVYETQTSNSDPYSYGNDPYQQRPQSLQQRQNSYNRNGSANDSRFGSTSRKNSAMNGVGVGAVAGSVAGASAASFASRRQNSSSNGQQQQNSYDPYTQTASSGTGSKNSDDPYAADPYSNNNDPYANYDPYSGNNDPYSSTGGGALSHSMSQLSVNGKQMSNTGSGSFQQQQLMDQNETALQQQEQQQQQQRSNDDDLDLNNYPGEYQNNTYQSYGEQEYDPYSQQEQEQVQEVDSEEEEVNRIIRQSKETREATVQSSQNILSHLRQADETATNTIGVLGSQREKMFQIERDLNTMGSQQRFVGEHVKDLEHYNRGLFHVKRFCFKCRIIKSSKWINWRIEKQW